MIRKQQDSFTKRGEYTLNKTKKLVSVGFCVSLLVFIYISNKNNEDYDVKLTNNNSVYEQSSKNNTVTKAMQTQIEEQLKLFDKVEDASVILINLYDNNDLKSNIQKTASVTLTTNGSITESEGKTLANMIAKNVDGLNLDNIEITDQNFIIVYSDKDGQ